MWELSVTAGRDPDGQLRRAFRTVRGNQTDACRALIALVAEIGDGHSLPSRVARGLTVDELVAAFLDHLRDHKGRKHSTLVRYRGLSDRWISPAIGDRVAERVLPQDVEAVLGDMRTGGLSQSSIHQTFTLLNGTFKWARRNRMMIRNPVTDAEEPRSTAVPHEVAPPDIEDLRRLLAEAMKDEPDFGLLCHLGAVTGMRRGELAGLRWDRADLDRRRLRVDITVNDAGGKVVIDNFTKTRRMQFVSIDPTTVELLRAHREAMEQRAALTGCELDPEAFVFSHSLVGYTPIRPEYLTRRMRQLRRRLGLEAAEFDATLQALRHWAQTALTEAGYDSRQVAARGGHSEQVMRSVYVHRTTASEQQMSAHLGNLLASSKNDGADLPPGEMVESTTSRVGRERGGSSRRADLPRCTPPPPPGRDRRHDDAARRTRHEPPRTFDAVTSGGRHRGRSAMCCLPARVRGPFGLMAHDGPLTRAQTIPAGSLLRRLQNGWPWRWPAAYRSTTRLTKTPAPSSCRNSRCTCRVPEPPPASNGSRRVGSTSAT